MGGKDEGYVESKPAVATAEKTITPAERPVGKAAAATPAGPARAATVVEEAPETGPKKLRYHESNGQVHFHGTGADKDLKCAIPVSDWFVCMRRVQNMEPYQYVDLVNKTVFHAESFLDNGVIDVALEITPVQVGSALNALSDFTTKRR